MQSKPVKPTLGIKPKHIWLDDRLLEIANAILRRLEANQSIPVEWVEERNELLKQLEEYLLGKASPLP